jgi:hypothetical protein
MQFASPCVDKKSAIESAVALEFAKERVVKNSFGLRSVRRQTDQNFCSSEKGSEAIFTVKRFNATNRFNCATNRADAAATK